MNTEKAVDEKKAQPVQIRSIYYNRAMYLNLPDLLRYLETYAEYENLASIGETIRQIIATLAIAGVRDA
jgi:hypothetical protein